jgi:tetratricopeptide (TPR) repeat protein
MTRKELRAPDAFQKAGGSIREWLRGRATFLVLGVVVIVLVSGATALANFISERKEDKAAKALGAALRTIDRSFQGADDEEAPAPEATSENKSAAKDEKLIKELTELRSKYPRTRAAATAGLPLAEAELRLGQHDQALAAFKDYLANAPASEPLRAAALEGEGYAYEGKGQLDEALASFDRMAQENKTEFLNGVGQFHRARILILQGKKQDAAAVLSDVKSNYPGSAAARLAAERLSRLASEGVTPPPKVSPDAGTPG